jgi:hypothetical protein
MDVSQRYLSYSSIRHDVGNKGDRMQHTLRPYVTTGIAIVGASLIAVTPVAPPPPNVQQRALKLVDYVEYDASQLASATEANWSALESILNSSHWVSDPDISQGLTTLFSDLSAGTSNAVTSPVSLLSEGLLGLLSTDYAANAASNALSAVTDNVESALSDGNYSLALTDLESGPTTILYALLNGYSDSVGSSLISPEFGLLTNTADGAATGQIDALAQISNTIADEVANLGGANLTTDSLPLLSGNLDLSVSVSQILTDLGLSSSGSPLTVDGLLSDLGIDPSGSILPADINIGDVLSELGLSDTSGISLGTILGDLGLSDTSGISVSTILSDLGLTDTSGLSLGTVLSDLGLSDTSGLTLGTILGDLGLTDTSGLSLGTVLSDLGLSDTAGLSLGTFLGDLGLSDTSGITIPQISLGTVLGDLGLSDTSGINLGTVLSDLGLGDGTSITPPSLTIPVDTILSDLGLANASGDITLGVPAISLGTILGDLGINTSAGFNAVTLITELVGNPSYTINLGITHLTLSLSQFLNDAGLGGTNITLGSVLGDLGINVNSSFTPPSLDIPVSTILNDLGIANTDGDVTLSVPSITLGNILGDLGLNDNSSGINISDILGALGLSDTSSITPPSIDIGDVLSTLGLNDNSSLGLSQILTALGLSDNSSLDVGQILGALGLSDNSSLGISQIISDLGLSDNSSLDVSQILGALGLSDDSTLGISQILGALGLSDDSGITLGNVLSALGVGDGTSISLPSISIDSILGDLGINPDENILTLLGISDPLTLDPTIGLDGGAVATYVDDVAKDLLAALGSIGPVSSELPTLLTTDPAIDLTTSLSSLFTDLDLPVAVSGNLSLDLTSVVAELLPGLF